MSGPNTADAPGTPAPEVPADLLTLADGFPQATIQQWHAEVVTALNRRRPPERQLDLEAALGSLRTTTSDGLQIEPLYVAAETPADLGYPGVMPFTRGTTAHTEGHSPWDVRQLHEDPDVARTRRHVLTDLERGVTSIWVRTGPDALSPQDLPEALADMLLDLAPVAVSSRHDQVAAASALIDLWAARGTTEPHGNLGLDALALAAVGDEADLSVHHHWVTRCLSDLPGVAALTVDVLAHHDAGASDVDELGLAIATGIEYLRDLEAAGIHPKDAVGQIEFRVSATADQFTTIARLRALRRLWARVGEVCGVPEQSRGARQHAVTSWRMLTREDPWVNMLRATIATFAASAGGAEQITVLPFDTVHGLPADFARRIARNTQVVLAEEANIGRVHDPAGGSWYVEALTDQLARRGWEFAQQIEAAGGMTQALTRSSLVADRLAASRAARDEQLAHRTASLTGVSAFPRLADEPLEREQRPEATQTGDVTLTPRRDAEIFEALRDRSRRHEQTAGAPPTVLVAGIGARRDYGARETFTTSLLGVGGIATRLVEGTDPQSVADTAAADGLPVVVLCSSPALNAEHAADFARALRAAGVQRVYLAGNPARELAEADRELVDGSLSDGMDVVAGLTRLLDELGVSA